MANPTPRARRIRVPLRRRLREVSRRAAFTLVWLAAAVGAWFLYSSSREVRTVRAVAETVEYHVATEIAARIVSVPAAVGDSVRRGELVAVLDAEPLRRELAVLSAELKLRNGELMATAAALGRQRLTDERSFAAAVDAAEVALLGAHVKRDAVKAELASVRGQYRRQKTLVSRRVAARESLERLRSERQVLSRRAELLEEAVEGLRGKRADARRRLEAFRAMAPTDEEDPTVKAALAPGLAAVEVAQTRLAGLEARRKRLLVRAPADGVVHRILLRAGDVAAAGQCVAILRPASSQRVLAYVDDFRARQLSVGSRAVVLDRSGSRIERAGRVVSLGAGLVPYPPQLQSLPNQKLWGRELVIEIDDPGLAVAALVPGQVLDVRFVEPGPLADAPARADSGTDRPGPGTDTGESPRSMRVPPALRRRSRVEPSALVWSDRRSRYLVASDDTGYRDLDAHAPWLLVMDERGSLAADPLVVKDLRALNDIESMAWLDDERLLLLSSLSTSRRGRRPRSRTLLIAVSVDETHLRATSEIALAEIIVHQDAADWQAALGLGIFGGELDPRLDIEGLAVLDDALLLGLKAPLGDGGCAMLWRLEEPERVLAGARLAPNQLRLRACLRLQSEAPSGKRVGGISDLLRLPDGGLLVLSTDVLEGEADPVATAAIGAEPSPAGAAWYLPPAALSGTLQDPVTPRLLRRFEGARPEGVALSGDRQRLVVVFDRGSDTPLWTTIDLPGATAELVGKPASRATTP